MILMSLVAVLAAICGGACVVSWFAVRHRPERSLPGTGIEVASVREQLRHVRADYAAAIPGRAPNQWHRRGLLAAATLAIRRLHYFQEHDTSISLRPEHCERRG